MAKQIVTIAKTESLELTKESFVSTKTGEVHESLWLWSTALNRNVFYKIKQEDLIFELLKSLEYHITKQSEAEKELFFIKSKIEQFAALFGYEEYPDCDKDFIASYR